MPDVGPGCDAGRVWGALLLIAGWQLDGDACPDAGQVEAALVRWSLADAPGRLSWRREGTELVVRWAHPDGAGTRTLPVAECAVLADEMVLMVERALRPLVPRASAGRLASAPVPAPVRWVGQASLGPKVSAAGGTGARLSVELFAPRIGGVHFGGGVGLGFAGRRIEAAAGRAEVSLRTISLGPKLTATGVLGTPWLGWAVDGGLAYARLRATATGLLAPATEARHRLGVRGGLRLFVGPGSLRLHVGAAARAWTRAYELVAAPRLPLTRVPRGELVFFSGITARVDLSSGGPEKF